MIKVSWKSIIIGLCVIINSPAPLLSEESAVADTLNMVSWAGPYSQSQVEAFNKPWTQETNNKIKLNIYDGSIDEIRAQVESQNIKWDIVDLEFSTAEQACNEGLLEEIDTSILPDGADGTPADQDFIEGTLHKCGVGNIVWSTIFFYDKAKIEIGPTTMSDFFDIEKYPGKRGMRKSPKANLEFALMADGIPAKDVYKTLQTPEGIDRAFAKLNSIKDHIVWWQHGTEPQKMISNGTVSMSTGFHGTIFSYFATEGKDFEIIWDGQVWEIDMWGILKGSKNTKLAMDYLIYTTRTEQQVRQASRIAIGPTRKSSSKRIGSYIHNPSIQMKVYSPTNPKNLKNAVRTNSQFWAKNINVITERFDAWLASST